jgi:hypothetical protein
MKNRSPDFMSLLESMFLPVITVAQSAIRLRSQTPATNATRAATLIATTNRRATTPLGSSTDDLGSRKLGLLNRFWFHLIPRHAFLKESFVLIN